MLFSKGSSRLLTLWCLFLCFPRSSSMFLLFESRAFLFMYEEKSPTAWRKKKCMQIWCSFPPVCAILRAPKSSDRFHNEKRRRHNLYTHPPFFVFALHMCSSKDVFFCLFFKSGFLKGFWLDTLHFLLKFSRFAPGFICVTCQTKWPFGGKGKGFLIWLLRQIFANCHPDQYSSEL